MQLLVVRSLLVLPFLFFFAFPLDVLYGQVSSDAVAARRAALERELQGIESEIKEQSRLLISKQQERVSLERDVAILNAEIRRAQLSIRARELEIEGLNTQIGNKEDKIDGLNAKLIREKESLAQILRKTNQIDDFTLVEVVLSNRELSDFFEDIDTFLVLKGELRDSFTEIAETKTDTEIEKFSLEDKKATEVELRNIQRLEKQKIEEKEAEKTRILNVTKGQEAVYQGIISTKEQTAAEIRSELFALRGSAAIPFEEALRYANEASTRTGVRPALVLGVIAQESRLGEFIGTGNWRSDMHPTRDKPIFAALMDHLGFDPDNMPVSAKPSYGWGGAMGPAQFIPSTWILYAGYSCTKGDPAVCTYNKNDDRIGNAVGSHPPNPYEPRTAFFASALLMSDNGADRGTRSSERLAALRYFAGWRNAEKPAYAFYGDGVMELADKYQRQIDILAAS